MPLLTVRCTDKEMELWKESANGDGRSLSSWVRVTLSGNVSLVVGSARKHAKVTPKNDAVEVVQKPSEPVVQVAKPRAHSLCPRCSRFGVPSCDACRKITLEST